MPLHICNLLVISNQNTKQYKLLSWPLCSLHHLERYLLLGSKIQNLHFPGNFRGLNIANQSKGEKSNKARATIFLQYKTQVMLPGNKSFIDLSFKNSTMQLETVILREVRKGKTHTIWYYLYMESKIWHEWTHLRNRNRFMDMENRPGVAKGKVGEWGIE